MGWNSGYAIMENTVITVYDAGVLTKEILDRLMDPFKNTDCDSGGSRGLVAKDGLGVKEIICKVMEPEKYQAVLDNPQWYEGEEPGTENHHRWRSSKAAYALSLSIWCEQWGMF